MYIDPATGGMLLNALVIVANIITGILTSIVFAIKKKSAFLGFILGFFTSVIGLFAAIFFTRRKNYQVCRSCDYQNNPLYKFCANCGVSLRAPIGWIVLVWLVFAAGFVNYYDAGIASDLEESFYISLAVQLAALIGSIVLLFIRNKAAKINGGIILALWIIVQGFGFLVGFSLATSSNYHF